MSEVKYIDSGKAAVLVDGQFGSTGKGLLAAYLAHQPSNEVDYAVTNASANAGHWTKYKDKEGFCCYHMPTFGVVQPDCKIYLNAGAIINPGLLFEELDTLNIDFDRVIIHPNAAVITDDHISQEKMHESGATSVASTQKGVGAALAAKIGRKDLNIAREVKELLPLIGIVDLNTSLQNGARVSVEVPQGYSLSINGAFYPYTTSRQCTVMQGLSDAGIHASFLGEVVQSMRTYPIRVGSIFDGKGTPIGTSGPVYPDQYELSWEKLGVPAEMTTVTGRVRRVFTWSWAQFLDAVTENRPTILFLNFLNYMPNEDLAHLLNQLGPKYRHIMRKDPIMLYGRGPNVEDVSTSPFIKGTIDDG